MTRLALLALAILVTPLYALGALFPPKRIAPGIQA